MRHSLHRALPPRSRPSLATLRVFLATLSLHLACTGPGVIDVTTTGDTAATAGTSAESTSTATSDSTTFGTTTSDPSAATTETSGAETSSTGTSTGGADCGEEETTCMGSLVVTCDGMGGITVEDQCEFGCVEGACLLCEPGTRRCDDDDHVLRCAPDGGSWLDVQVCDAVKGETCSSGWCDGPCSNQSIYDMDGCEFYPTVTANVVSDTFHFAVAVVNNGDEPANVRIDRGDAIVAMSAVAAQSVEVVELPWVDELKDGVDASSVVVGGAFRLRSDRPVEVFQYSPLEYTIGDASSRTGDATRLYPSRGWREEAMVASSNTWRSSNSTYYPGFYAVTAAVDGTTVELHPSTTGALVRPGAGVAADGTGTITLDRGDVLQVFSGGAGPNPIAADLTGTRVEADKPIQVLGGHMCTALPQEFTTCDHLEELMPFPDVLYAAAYVVAPLDELGLAPRPQRVRIIAVREDTSLEYDPPQEGAPTEIVNAGDYVEIPATAESFVVIGTHRILVTQTMLSENAVKGPSDPAMHVAVGGNTFVRPSYRFHAPTDYEASFVNIITHARGAEIVVDGALVSDLTPLGSSGFAIARVKLDNAGDGSHTVDSKYSASVSVYGYGQYGSYWFGTDFGVLIMPP